MRKQRPLFEASVRIRGFDSRFPNVETKPLDSTTRKSLILLAMKMAPFGLLWTSAPP